MTNFRRRYTWIQNIGRLLKKKLIIPLWRSPHPPEYKALGVAIGLGWAMTPLVGVQMYLVWMTWLIMKKVFNKPFSLALGLAWTWVTNVFTMVPIYYVFYLTGRLMMGKGLTEDHSVKQQIAAIFLGPQSFIQKWGDFFRALMKEWGLTMMMGCIPFVIAALLLGYYVTLRYESLREHHRQLRQQKREQNGTTRKF